MRGFFLLAIFIISAPVNALYTGNSNDIRILISKSATNVELKGNLIIGTPRDKMLVSRAGVATLPGGFSINGRVIKTDGLTIISEGSPILFNNRRYNGAFSLHKDESDKITVVNILPLEEYLAGLVTSEMPSDWPLESLKAQAVTARTYALYQKDIRKPSQAIYDVEASVLDQVYGGITEDDGVKDAVAATAGEILMYHGESFKSFFHSTCGSQTELPMNVWGEKNIFPVIIDKYCARSPYNEWRYSISRLELAKRLRSAGFPAETVEDIRLEKNGGGLRAATVIIDTGGQTVFIRSNDFRKIVGFDSIKSTWFNVGIRGNYVGFAGRGFGHGVGMCQWGAKGMAEAGKSYREILKFYYPGAKIKKGGQ